MSGAVPSADSDGHVPEPKNFEPKTPVTLEAPKDDVWSTEELNKCDDRADGDARAGSNSSKPTVVAIKGVVYDVTGNKSYLEGGPYHLFAGKDASRALGKASLKAEDISGDYSDLDEKEMKVLDEWVVFFSKRYNVLGKVE
ncbi:hypothetical protein MMC25_007806 [Agyrium rufum]|nr:hypothetical protein [Agyrium rufum]